ncbi:MAG: helix-turn-helix transcriptional regulator [Bacteroidaceae bacterium]|nr:helix-turn-helix transcriptional regulator [Bacteroidaceae bacterium]
MENQKTELQIEIIGRIKNMRQQNGISQKDMADYLDVTAGEIGNIESQALISKSSQSMKFAKSVVPFL